MLNVNSATCAFSLQKTKKYQLDMINIIYIRPLIYIDHHHFLMRPKSENISPYTTIHISNR